MIKVNREITIEHDDKWLTLSMDQARHLHHQLGFLIDPEPSSSQSEGIGLDQSKPVDNGAQSR
jgi:hypothetical protein